MTCHWIRPNVRHSAILESPSGFDFDHITAVIEILSKIGPPSAARQKKMTSCQFSRWRISAILDFRDSIRFLWKSQLQLTKLLSFPENRVFTFWRQHPRWRISIILDFRGPVMGSLKSSCTTSYRSSIQTIALNILVFFIKYRFFCILATDRQTDKQTNRWTAPMH